MQRHYRYAPQQSLRRQGLQSLRREERLQPLCRQAGVQSLRRQGLQPLRREEGLQSLRRQALGSLS